MLLASGSGEAGALDARKLRAIAERSVRALTRERMEWTDALVSLLRAGLVYTSGAEGHREEALAHLADAERRFEALGTRLLVAVTRRRRGELVGGAEGRALVDAAEAWMTAEGIRNPDKVCALYAPGLGSARR